MKFISLGILLLAFTFCGITDKIKQLSAGGGGNSNVASGGKNTGSGKTSSSGPVAEPAKPTSAQQTIIDGGSGYVWDDQGVSWRLPSGWKRMDVSKTQFNYESPDNAFLLASVSDLGDSFPMDTSLQAYYDQAMQKLKSGDYEDVKMVSIDSIPGVEFTEAAPKGKDDVRRHQWIGYRRYLGQVQQLNVMTSTKASNFAKHEDDFAAILYSMKATK